MHIKKLSIVQKKSTLRFGFVIPLILAVGGSVCYISVPPTNKDTVSRTKIDYASTKGILEAVMTPPKTFKGRNGNEEFSPEQYSSNPKRDPSEQLVINIASERGDSDESKVTRLLELIPSLPVDAQTLAMENATALIPDADYLSYRSRLLQLARSPEMRAAVMEDSLTRGEEIRLPNLLELMRTSISEQEKQEIREIFEAYLDKDYGPHAAQWEAPLLQWVSENTDS